MNILIVDDTKSVHAFIDAIFEGTQNALHHVFDGSEAVSLLSKEHLDYDLILMDWEMPILTGVETLKKIREMGISTKIIMITTKNKMEEIQSAINLGANEYVMKPFTKDILFEKIERVTNLKVF